MTTNNTTGKIRINLKDPDALYESIGNAVRSSLPNGLTDEECELLAEGRQDILYEKLKKWFTYGELVSLEYDTTTDTLKVLESSK
jgi:hypothetical protein